VLIGGVGAGTVLTHLFLPALYAIWFKVTKPSGREPQVLTSASAPATLKHHEIPR
jgi:hypothetical protein